MENLNFDENAAELYATLLITIATRGYWEKKRKKNLLISHYYYFICLICYSKSFSF